MKEHREDTSPPVPGPAGSSAPAAVPKKSGRNWIKATVRFTGIAVGMLVLAILAAWGVGALYFDLPFPQLRVPAALLFAAVMAGALLFTWPFRRKAIVMCAGFALVLCWWLTIQPRSDRNWQPNVAETAWAEINGDNVTLHNVRNCDYRSWNDYTPRWETRTMRLSQITGVDLFIDYWGSPGIAHPIVSFQFCRMRRRWPCPSSTEAGGPGLFCRLPGFTASMNSSTSPRMSGMWWACARIISTRIFTSTTSKCRPGMPASFFSNTSQPSTACMNIPAGITPWPATAPHGIGAQKVAQWRIPWDWRILLNGKGDEMLYEHGLFAGAGELPFAELKHHALIDAAAKAAGSAPDFSARVRAGLPWF